VAVESHVKFDTEYKNIQDRFGS